MNHSQRGQLCRQVLPELKIILATTVPGAGRKRKAARGRLSRSPASVTRVCPQLHPGTARPSPWRPQGARWKLPEIPQASFWILTLTLRLHCLNEVFFLSETVNGMLQGGQCETARLWDCGTATMWSCDESEMWYVVCMSIIMYKWMYFITLTITKSEIFNNLF